MATRIDGQPEAQALALPARQRLQGLREAVEFPCGIDAAVGTTLGLSPGSGMDGFGRRYGRALGCGRHLLCRQRQGPGHRRLLPDWRNLGFLDWWRRPEFGVQRGRGTCRLTTTAG